MFLWWMMLDSITTVRIHPRTMSQWTQRSFWAGRVVSIHSLLLLCPGSLEYWKTKRQTVTKGKQWLSNACRFQSCANLDWLLRSMLGSWSCSAETQNSRFIKRKSRLAFRSEHIRRWSVYCHLGRCVPSGLIQSQLISQCPVDTKRQMLVSKGFPIVSMYDHHVFLPWHAIKTCVGNYFLPDAVAQTKSIETRCLTMARWSLPCWLKTGTNLVCFC